MIIYFAGSIRGGRQDAELYRQLISHLKKYGRVLTEHIGDEDLDTTGETGLDDSSIHDRDISWVLESDVVIAEVTTISLGVGYEIGRAVENQKMIVCLYRQQPGKRLSAMIAGSPDIINYEYKNIGDATIKLDSFFTTFFKREK